MQRDRCVLGDLKFVSKFKELGRTGRHTVATSSYTVTDRVSRECKAVGSIRLSVRLSVRLFPLYLLNGLILS